MEQMSGYSPIYDTRRWPRFAANLPVRIVGVNRALTTAIPATGSEISRGGMALRVAMNLKPGDLMQIQFPTSAPSRVTAVVRNRVGDCLGLEFLTQLPPDDVAIEHSKSTSRCVPPRLAKPLNHSCKPHDLYASLRRKQQEFEKLKRQIEALQISLPLLTAEQ